LGLDANLTTWKLPVRLNGCDITCKAKIGIVMKGATTNEKQDQKNMNDPKKAKEQTAQASRENIYQAKKSSKRARMRCEESARRSYEPTR